MEYGGVHLTIDDNGSEGGETPKRWRVADVITEEGNRVVEGSKVTFSSPSSPSPCGTTIHWSHGDPITHLSVEIQVVLHCSPFSIVISRSNVPIMTFNALSLFNFEGYRQKNPKPLPPTPVILPPVVGEDGAIMTVESPVASPSDSPPSSLLVDPSDLEYPYDDDSMWSYAFGGNTDEISRGPSTVSGDIRFHSSATLFGLPEHAASLALKSTRHQSSGDYGDPYRLYNLDVFEYELDNPMALYGAVPLIISHSKTVGSCGALWLNSAETFIDIFAPTSDHSRDSHWISESGIVDIYFLVGPSPPSLHHQYGILTGFPELPQRFSLGYHQCRWNYKSEDDVSSVDNGFDSHDIPYDTLWLDIEHTDGKKYFTWDQTNFPHPVEMQNHLAQKGRRMVTIVDPHIKRDNNYYLHKEADSGNFYVKNAQNVNYEGWCWPGSVSYLDFLLPSVREFWAKHFAYSSYSHSTPSLFTWNDMNEPSVFNGPEVTMTKENLHLEGTVPHRDVHNVYGFYNQMATHLGLITRDVGISEAKRSFVLSRSFFAGSQRYGAVWTGDNKAEWSHLQASHPMLLSMGLAGITFSGADIGGFFGDPSTELLVRWYQSATFHPFMRGHAHIDAKRREPWLFGEAVTNSIRSTIKLRYSLLPYIYTTFYDSSRLGVPVMRPLWTEFPHDENIYTEENTFLLGNSFLIAPVTQAGITKMDIYLPGTSSDYFYSMLDGIKYMGGATHTMECPLHVGIPHFQLGGQITPQKWRARRSSDLMEKDPLTVVITLDHKGEAKGSLYEDDGQTFRYEEKKGGEYAHVEFALNNGILSGTPNHSHYSSSSSIERIILWGQHLYSKATLIESNGNPVSFPLELMRDYWGRLTIRNPRIETKTSFKIQME